MLNEDFAALRARYPSATSGLLDDFDACIAPTQRTVA
jgi:hypothetical protein